jgi:hypothetical protein
MTLAETVVANISQLRRMRDDGRTWPEIAAWLSEQIGNTVSDGSLKAAFSKASKAAPAPVQIEKVVEVEEVEPEEEKVDFSAFDDQTALISDEDEDDEETTEPVVSVIQQQPSVLEIDHHQQKHLLRIGRNRLNEQGWTEFLSGPAVGLLVDRYKWFNPSSLARYPSNPNPHTDDLAWLVVSVASQEFFRLKAQQVNTANFQADFESANVERRLLLRFKTDRKTLYEAIVSTFGPTHPHPDFIMLDEGYFAAVQTIDNNHFDFAIPTIKEIHKAGTQIRELYQKKAA